MWFSGIIKIYLLNWFRFKGSAVATFTHTLEIVVATYSMSFSEKFFAKKHVPIIGWAIHPQNTTITPKLIFIFDKRITVNVTHQNRMYLFAFGRINLPFRRGNKALFRIATRRSPPPVHPHANGGRDDCKWARGSSWIRVFYDLCVSCLLLGQQDSGIYWCPALRDLVFVYEWN